MVIKVNVVFEACCVQTNPSELLKMIPASLTATMRAPDAATALNLCAPARCAVQVAPSGDVCIVSADPSATKRPFAHIKAVNVSDVPEFATDQVRPSGDLSTIPSAPTATKP